MPDPLPLTGLFGKLPAHGDFVRRGLPTSFVGPWDAWLQSGMEAARERLGDRWAAAWDAAPVWRFALPAGACGPDAVAGIMVTSQDMVGRRFPLTLAALLPPGAGQPGPAWFAALEAAALTGRAGRADVDALAARIPAPDAMLVEHAWPVMEGTDPPAAAAADDFSAAWAAAPRPEAGGEAIGLPGGDAAAGEDVLALLGGGAAASTADMLGAEPSVGQPAGDDVLGLLGSPAPAPEPMPQDGTLTFLLGQAADGPAVLLPGGGAEAPETADGLVALIASGAPPAVADGQPAPMIPDAIDLLPDEATPPTPVELPPAPPGGGWWTGGSARLPPASRALSTLPPPAEFVSLLEADA